MKHSEGPFTIDIQKHPQEWEYIIRGKPTTHPTLGPEIARLNSFRIARDGMGDAYLLSAAPDLLQVAEGALGYLRSLPEQYRPDSTWFKPLEDAIHKARGEL